MQGYERHLFAIVGGSGGMRARRASAGFGARARLAARRRAHRGFDDRALRIDPGQRKRGMRRARLRSEPVGRKRRRWRERRTAARALRSGTAAGAQKCGVPFGPRI